MAKKVELTREHYNILKKLHNTLFDTLMDLDVYSMCAGNQDEDTKKAIQDTMRWHHIYVTCLEDILVKMDEEE